MSTFVHMDIYGKSSWYMIWMHNLWLYNTTAACSL